MKNFFRFVFLSLLGGALFSGVSALAAQSHVERQRTGGDALDGFQGLIAESHDGALAELLLDLLQGQLDVAHSRRIRTAGGLLDLVATVRKSHAFLASVSSYQGAVRDPPAALLHT